MRALVPPVWLAKKLSILGEKISRDCRVCPILEFEVTCKGFQKTFKEAYQDANPKRCPKPIVALGWTSMRLLPRLFKGLDDCRTCELRDFCLESCGAFKEMYEKAWGDPSG